MEVVELLLAHGVDKDAKDKKGQTALTKATASGVSAVVRLLMPK